MPEALDPLVAELVAVAEELVAAAYREHDGAASAAAAASPSRFVATMSAATRRWSRSWPPPM